jgi:subtilisin family serine protease
MRATHLREKLEHRSSIEAFEPRRMMTAQSPIGVVLNASVVPNDGTVNPSTLSAAAAQAVAAATTTTTTTSSSIDSLVGLTAEQATYGLTGVGQTVAVIDSGVAYDHPALGGGYGPQYRVVGGWDFAQNDANPYDFGPGGGHGTAVNGIIGSSDPTSPGVAPGVDLVDLRVFNDQGVGSFTWVDEALKWVNTNRNAFEYPITTVNISIGSTWNALTVPNWSTLEGDLAQLKADGIFIAVAAGNSFTSYNAPGLSYPASSPYVVPVMSVDNDGSLSSFSQRASLAIGAPGESIRTTVPDYLGNLNGKTDDFATFSGTSMAAPFIAGVSVLLREAMEIAGMTNITEDSIYSIMRNTADVVYDPVTSADYLRINVDRALASIMPADDYGNTPSRADRLGTTSSATVSGLIGTLSDHDDFTFTAAATGSASVTVTGKDELHAVLQRVGGASQASNGGDTISFNVVAGQSYTIDLSSSQGIGRYSLGLNITAPPLALGVVDSLELNHQNLSGAQSYSFTASRNGIVTVQALGGTGNANVAIFNSAQQPIASIGGPSPGRADVNATAGEVFYVRVSGGASDGTLRITNLVSQSGSTLNVSGTAGNDSFQFVAGSGFQLTVDGTTYSYAAGTLHTINFSGGGGNDSIKFTGGSGNESAVFSSAGLQLSGPNYQLRTSGFESITVVAGLGANNATLYGSTGGSTYISIPTAGVLQGLGYYYGAYGFQTIDVVAAAGGTNNAYFYDSPGNDVFTASASSAQMVGTGFSNHAVGFNSVSAWFNNGGQDVANLSDSMGNSTLVAAPHVASLTGAGYTITVNGFSQLQATASQGTNHADLSGSAGNDTFVASPLSAELSGAGYDLRVRGFNDIQANALFGGHDVADLTGSAGNDTLLETPSATQLTGAGYSIVVKQFDRVQANSGGGYDVANLYDSATSDLLQAAGVAAELSGSDYELLANNFQQVNVYGVAGGTNTKHVQAVDFALNTIGQWE